MNKLVRKSLLPIQRNEEEKPGDQSGFVAIVPSSREFVREAFHGIGRLLIEDKVENVPTSESETLGQNEGSLWMKRR